MNITEEQERIEDEYKKLYSVFNNGQIRLLLIWLIIIVDKNK